MGKKKTSPVQNGIDADVFLKCFNDKISDIRSATSGSGTPSFSPFTGSQKLNSFPVLCVDDIRNLLARAANNSCGLDPAPTWLVKEYADQLAPFLVVFFNKSLSTGYFPNSFRIAEITPILKKSTLDPTIPGNYRHISNLQFISKVLERVVNEQLMLHLRINDLLPEHQSAYRSCHSTESALLKVTSDGLLAADRGKLTLLGMLDMSAAFDCVDHIILIRRLNVSFGIDENALDWIVSYIMGRRQYVRYNGRTSDISVVECGVPQGSVLGPLYFVLFTADVFGIADEHGFAIHGYADDMQIYDHCVVEDLHHLTSRLVDCIGSIGVWMTNNRLKLNASKTEFIWFGSARRLARCTFEAIVVNGSSILPSKTVRNLGVVLDPSLSLAAHCRQADKYIVFSTKNLYFVFSDTSAANDPSNAHQ